jgi:hypothetical protein
MASRSLTYLELAAAIAVGGSIVAVAIPAFLRNLHASRLTEATRGVTELAENASAYARGKASDECFPPSAPLTPSQVPRGVRVTDPPGTWDHLTWAALGFSVTHAHYFSFAFESQTGPERGGFVARAHGDLDGDGERSTFEIRGECAGGVARVIPGLYVDREVE